MSCRDGHCWLFGSEVRSKWTGDLRPSESSCGEDVYLAAVDITQPRKVIMYMLQNYIMILTTNKILKLINNLTLDKLERENSFQLC